MELEQRVKLLEQEVKLLKSEVQATLLDIQEQLLSTRFPALRADAAPQPGPATPPDQGAAFRDPAPATRNAPLKTAPAAARHEALDVFEADPPPAPRPSAAGYATRSVKLNPEAAAARPAKPAANGKAAANGKSANHGKPAAAALAEPDVAAPPASATDWETISRQTEWTLQTVKKIGPERTRHLIEVYAQSGLLSKEITTVMTRLTGVLPAEAPPAVAAPAPAPEPEPAPASPSAPAKASDPQKKEKRNIILRAINYLQNAGVRQEETGG